MHVQCQSSTQEHTMSSGICGQLGGNPCCMSCQQHCFPCTNVQKQHPRKVVLNRHLPHMSHHQQRRMLNELQSLGRYTDMAASASKKHVTMVVWQLIAYSPPEQQQTSLSMTSSPPMTRLLFEFSHSLSKLACLSLQCIAVPVDFLAH